MYMQVKRMLALAVLPGVVAACGGTPRSETGVFTREITVTGCLRGGEEAGTYVVTADTDELAAVGQRAIRGQVPTYTYVLEATRDLDALVGQQVEVTGKVAESDEFQHEQSEEAELPEQSLEGDPFTPTVEVEKELAVRLRALQVADVRSLGSTCQAGN